MADTSSNSLSTQQVLAKENKTADIIISHTICLVAAFVAVVLRLVSRRISKSPLKADDHMIVVSLVRIELDFFISFWTRLSNDLTVFHSCICYY